MTDPRPRARHYAEYAAWKAVEWLAGHLSRRAAVVLSDAMGRLLFSVARMRRRLVMSNLAIAFGGRRPPAELRRIALRAYQNSVLTFLEVMNPRLLGTPDDGHFAEPEGGEHFYALKGRPAVAMLAHIGNFEAIAVYAAREKVPFKAIAKLLHNPLINREVLAMRRAGGVEIIPASGNMKAAVDAIGRGEWVGISGDQNSRRAGVYVEFFGKPASTFAGAALFAWKMNVPILPVFTVREPGPLRRPRVIVCPAIHPDPAAPKDDEVLRLTRAHVAALEAVVERHPEDYWWFHRRWRDDKRPREKPRMTKSGQTDTPTERRPQE